MGLRGIEGLDPGREAVFWRPAEPGPEERIEDHFSPIELELVIHDHAMTLQRLELEPSLALDAAHVDAAKSFEPAPSMQVPRRREPVTSVGANATHHSGSPVTSPRSLPARGLHQPIEPDAEALGGELVELFDLAATEAGKRRHLDQSGVPGRIYSCRPQACHLPIASDMVNVKGRSRVAGRQMSSTDRGGGWSRPGRRRRRAAATSGAG